MEQKIKTAAPKLFPKYGPKRTTINDIIWKLLLCFVFVTTEKRRKEEMVHAHAFPPPNSKSIYQGHTL